MNLIQRALMDAPSCTPGYCVVCGAPYPTEHHVVPRSQGGHAGPVVHLCGHGTTGCHGEAEARRMHLRYDEGWWWLRVEQAIKYDAALMLPGWTRVGV